MVSWTIKSALLDHRGGDGAPSPRRAAPRQRELGGKGVVVSVFHPSGYAGRCRIDGLLDHQVGNVVPRARVGVVYDA
jgi:hypothetical protein